MVVVRYASSAQKRTGGEDWHQNGYPIKTRPLYKSPVRYLLQKSCQAEGVTGVMTSREANTTTGFRHRWNCADLDPCVESRDPALGEDPLNHHKSVRFLFGSHDLRQHHLCTSPTISTGNDDTWHIDQSERLRRQTWLTVGRGTMA